MNDWSNRFSNPTEGGGCTTPLYFCQPQSFSASQSNLWEDVNIFDFPRWSCVPHGTFLKKGLYVYMDLSCCVGRMNDIKRIINNLKNNHDNFITMILDVESEMMKLETKGDDVYEVYDQFISDIDLSEDDIEALGLTDGLLSDREMFDNITLLKTLVRGTNTIQIVGKGQEFDLIVNDRYITGGDTESIINSLRDVMNGGYLVELV